MRGSELVDVDKLRSEVQEKYREVAEDPAGSYHFHTGRAQALRLGYPISPLDQLPEEACEAFAGVANPFYWDTPHAGERVVDLGSGAGMDSFLTAIWVGAEGRVIGVDMTPEMLARSRSMASKLGLDNVEFREGLIEQLPGRGRLGGRGHQQRGDQSVPGQARCLQGGSPHPQARWTDDDRRHLRAEAGASGCAQRHRPLDWLNSRSPAVRRVGDSYRWSRSGRHRAGTMVETFAGAGGEEKARQFGTYGLPIRARKLSVDK